MWGIAFAVPHFMLFIKHIGLEKKMCNKKHMDRLKAAKCFGDFLKLGLGKPEQLEGYLQILRWD